MNRHNLVSRFVIRVCRNRKADVQTTAFFACGSSSQLNTEKWLFLQTPVEATIERPLMEISIETMLSARELS